MYVIVDRLFASLCMGAYAFLLMGGFDNDAAKETTSQLGRFMVGELRHHLSESYKSDDALFTDESEDLQENTKVLLGGNIYLIAFFVILVLFKLLLPSSYVTPVRKFWKRCTDKCLGKHHRNQKAANTAQKKHLARKPRDSLRGARDGPGDRKKNIEPQQMS